MSLTVSWHLGRADTVRSKHRRGKPLPMLARTERVLYRLDAATGATVATDEALLQKDAGAAWRRVAWSDVASMARVGERIVLRSWPDATGAGPGVCVPANPRLVALMRERVAAHRLLCVPIDLDGNTGTVIAVRDGAGVRWHVILGRSADDAATRRACAAAVAEIRALAGI